MSDQTKMSEQMNRSEPIRMNDQAKMPEYAMMNDQMTGSETSGGTARPDSDWGNCRGGEALARAVEAAYAEGQTDYYLEPLSLDDADGRPLGRIRSGDQVVFCCRRGEREIELTEAFTDPDFKPFERPLLSDLPFVTMTLYRDKFRELPVAFAPEQVRRPLAEIISEAGLRQYHCAESEKYAHVTYFFNGGAARPFEGETDFCVPSPKGIPFDQQPELSLPQLSESLCAALDEGYDFVLTNFANGDVIGHTANTGAKLKAAAAVSTYAGRVAAHAKACGYTVLVTADHGNIETLYDRKGNPHVAHTTNPVPFIVIDPNGRSLGLRDGRLADVAPTVLDILGLSAPPEMTGRSLIDRAASAPDIGNTRVLLMILDGWGHGTGDDNDGIFAADTPDWDALLSGHPHSRLAASGSDVGLQAGKPGNSEAGHSNLGAGRIVLQDDVRLDTAIRDGSFKTNPVFLNVIERARSQGALHLLALLTEKSSHGSIDYPLMLAEMADGVPEIYFHIIFDGRSTEPGSAPALLRTLDERLAGLGRGRIVDGVGRGLALDRDGNYEKIERVYRSLTAGAQRRYRL